MSSPSRRLERIRELARWTEAEAQIAVEEFRESGLSAEEFGDRNGLHPVCVLRWAARLARKATRPLILPVHVSPVPGQPAVHVEIALGSRILRVPADLDGAQVARLVRAVESA